MRIDLYLVDSLSVKAEMKRSLARKLIDFFLFLPVMFGSTATGACSAAEPDEWILDPSNAEIYKQRPSVSNDRRFDAERASYSPLVKEEI